MKKKIKALRIFHVFKRIKKQVRHPSTKALGTLAVVFLTALSVWALQNYGGRSVNIELGATGESVQFPQHPLTGIRCAQYARRPLAVMMALDPVARPLSGIAAADIVVEMPVGNDGVTRAMALFLCEEASEIGSVRSARDDFIPLAASFNAIFVHWGGSSFALEQLDAGVVDNIDALTNPASAFFRKRGIPGPHDGFTTYAALVRAAERLDYRFEINHEAYPIAPAQPVHTDTTSLMVGYRVPYDVHYLYNKFTNTYFRWRAGSPENDAIDGRQAEVSAVVVLVTEVQKLTEEYNDVTVVGPGRLLVFQNGAVQKGTWRKDGARLMSPLQFLTADGEDMALVAGKKWIEIISPDTAVQWGEERVQ
jgi:hypothetical protein